MVVFDEMDMPVLDDMNSAVDEIFSAKRLFVPKKEKKRRFKMSKEQEAILQLEFDKNANWDNETYAKLETLVKTSKARLYKWNWDRKKRINSSCYESSSCYTS